ncbi:MAG TPA: matrixin family metalloprotease [Labilithrix sp.]|nr:matrixin family metalloprotease [Labilithrix sp.]
MSGRHWFGALFAISALLAAPEAHAFCRTMTERPPPDHDPILSGCYTGGIPLFWRNACIGYSLQRELSRKISYTDAANAISAAFTRWTGATCPVDASGNSQTSIDARDLGPADCARVEYRSGLPNQNVIIFRDQSWPYSPSVLGLATVIFSPQTGEIFNADLELYTIDMVPLAVRVPVAPDAYDFASVVTHEVGHFFGIAHSDVEGSTMFARYDPGETRMRYLSPDDISAICTVYSPARDREIVNGRVVAAPQCDPTPRGGYSQQCAEREDPGCAITTQPPRSATGLAYALALAGAVAVRRARRPATKSDAISSKASLFSR